MQIIKVKFMRSLFRLLTGFAWRGAVPKNVLVQTRSIRLGDATRRVRIYTPRGSGPFPVIAYFHGGGFVIGSIETYDAMCRDLCVSSDAIVVAVDYRLAPEHPFPQAALDCYAALEWIVKNAGSFGGMGKQVIVAGDSAGGNLATVSALQARTKLPGAIKGQILLYPVTDHYDPPTESYNENARGHRLTRSQMIWFWDLYLRRSAWLSDGQTRHELATPLTVEDLSGLPPALVITAEKDPLRDEGIAYARRMAEQGVLVQHRLYRDAEHGFIGLAGPTAQHREAMTEITTWLDQLVRRRLDTPVITEPVRRVVEEPSRARSKERELAM
jgi:acetyl esterase